MNGEVFKEVDTFLKAALRLLEGRKVWEDNRIVGKIEHM